MTLPYTYWSVPLRLSMKPTPTHCPVTMTSPYQLKLPRTLRSPSSTTRTPYPVTLPLSVSAVKAEVGSAAPLMYTILGLAAVPQHDWLA